MSFWKKLIKEKEKKEESKKEKDLIQKKANDTDKRKSSKLTEIYQTEKGFVFGPVFSEKARQLAKQGQYTFYVKPDANKVEIRQEIERMFQVKIDDIRTVNLAKRVRGVTRIPSVRPRLKKAIVRLKQGTISIFE